MALVVLALLVYALTGCGTIAQPGPRVDNVCFDRGAFSLGLADALAPALAKCEKTAGPSQTPACVKLETANQQARQAIIDAPKNAARDAPPAPSPFDALWPVLMKLAPLAL